MAIFGDFFASCVFSKPRAAGFRNSDLHLIFALRQTSNLRRLRLGEEKKKERKKKKPQGKNIMVCPIP